MLYIECGKKKCSNIFYWVKKKDLFGCFREEEIRDKDNETSLKEEGGKSHRNRKLQCFSIYAMHAFSFAF